MLLRTLLLPIDPDCRFRCVVVIDLVVIIDLVAVVSLLLPDRSIYNPMRNRCCFAVTAAVPLLLLLIDPLLLLLLSRIRNSEHENYDESVIRDGQRGDHSFHCKAKKNRSSATLKNRVNMLASMLVGCLSVCP